MLDQLLSILLLTLIAFALGIDVVVLLGWLRGPR
jgi:hypothetical protein